jgi:hypothetical protein
MIGLIATWSLLILACHWHLRVCDRMSDLHEDSDVARGNIAELETALPWGPRDW